MSYVLVNLSSDAYDLLQSVVVDATVYRQAYCLNPPADVIGASALNPMLLVCP